MLQRIEHLGQFIGECSLPGETTADIVAPAHPNGIQLSQDRFLILNATLGFRSVDDSLSTTWQLRKDNWDGAVIKEGFFSQTCNDWDPFDLGVTWKKETGAMTAFGVPKGALIAGERVPHENVFVCKFRVCGRAYIPDGPDGPYIKWADNDDDLWRSHYIGWVQFRLSDDDNDIEIIQDETRLRQVGYETGDAFCERKLRNINQTFAGLWPLTADCGEWVDVAHASSGEVGELHLHVLRYRFNPESGLYEWVETGPAIGENLFEGSIVPYKGEWLIAGRVRGNCGVAWTRTSNPFAPISEWTIPDDVKSCNAPITVYRCGDGVIRLLSGDGSLSPHADPEKPGEWIDNRNPLYIWDIDPENNFKATATQTVYDMVDACIPIERKAGPVCDMGKVLPHTGGKEQFILHRVRSCSFRNREPKESLSQWVPYELPVLTDEELDAIGIYAAKIHYSEDCPAMWSFAD
jgi:hypothetical protein